MQYIIGTAIGCSLLVVLLVLLGVYAVRQKKRAQREKLRNDPFGNGLFKLEFSFTTFFFSYSRKFTLTERTRNWKLFIFILDISASWKSGEKSGEAPKLSAAKAFTYDELKMCTNSFKKINIIGSGGYGKVNPILRLI